MTIRPIITLPDARLRLRSEPVAAITDAVRALAADMLETMYDAPGVGLAAIQIGVPQRIVAMDVPKTETERAPMVLINPEISGPPRRSAPTRRAASRSPNITRRSSARSACASATWTSTAGPSSRTPRA